MSVKIESSEDGRVIKIYQTVALWVRLIGLPFFLFGLYVFSMFFYSIYYYSSDANLKQWLIALPGFVLTLLFAVIFILPGLFFIFGRLGQLTICNFNTKQILSFDSLLPWKKAKISPLKEFHLVKVEYVARRTGSRSRSTGSVSSKAHYYFEVNLYGNDDRQLHLVSFLDSQENEAVALSRKIGQLCMIKVEENPWATD